jgi:hypothetical protein
MEPRDLLTLRHTLDKDVYVRKVNNRDCSEFNRQQMLQKIKTRKQEFQQRINLDPPMTYVGQQPESEEDLTYLNNCARLIYANQPSGSFDRFETSNKKEYYKKQVDLSKFKKFYKRKNQFQQWSDALYNTGVFFNPAVNGL